MKILKAKLLWSFLYFLLALPSISLAQSYSGYNWYFGGSQNGIRFSRSDGSATLVTNQATGLGTGGGAVASDATNGDLLFYTDGANIYDRTHAVMPNGTGLGANTSGNQAVAIAKVPGQDNQYYVFTNSADGTTGGAISYRIVDMSLGGNAVFPTPPAGEATTATNTAVPGLTTSEAMMIIPHPNGDDFWLITHASGTADYMVTQFTPSGPSTTTTFTGLGLIEYAANFSYHPGTGRIAVSPQEGTRDVEILNFDPATGGLTFQQTVLNSGVASTTNPAVYDTEWSANGQYLYISRTGEPGIPADILQYDLNNPSNTLASILPVPPGIVNSYGLQMAPDSTIYHIYQATSGGPYLVGQISDTDSLANLVQYNPQPFPGNPDFAGTQFPSFAPRDTVDISVAFTAQGTCANAPTSFFPTVTPTADSLVWDFGDGSGSSDWSPVYTYEAGGAFNVSVTAYLNGQTETTTQPINITDFDTQISLVQDTTACSCELPYSKKTNPPSPPPNPCGSFSVTAQINGSGTPQLQWYGPSGLLAGQTTGTLTPDSAGYYYLVATVGGCTTYAGVNIKEYSIQDQRANIWYFGNNAGIDFNPLPDDPAKPISNPVMNSPEGTATISDRNGQVIFYTDGDKVWNRTNVEIATGIGGEPGSSQSALIIPVPGDETLYYIFTTQEVHGTGTYEIRYSLFDLKLNGGTGGLVEQNVLLFSRSTERLTGNANWLIAHEYGNNSFRSYRITQQGISNPVISSIGSDHAYTAAENGQGYMKLGSQNRLAVALSTPGVSNVVEIFDFADSTGVISNFRSADLESPAGQVYGVEFSPGGNKLFATLQNGGASQIKEFAFDSLAVPYLKEPPIDVPAKLGAIQMGPDGQVYVAVDGGTSLGTIQVVEDTTQVSSFTLDGFGLLGGTNSNLGLPNFIQTIADPIQGPGIAVVGACIGDSVSFQGTPTDPIDEFFWQVSQAGSVLTTSDQQGFNYLFTNPGNYNVSLRLTNRCGLDTTLTQAFTISNVPPNPTAAVVLCTGSEVLDANPSDLPGLTYVWSTGDSTETITVSRQGIYRVTVTNAAGCSTDGDIRAVDNRPIVDLGDNITICQNTPIAPLNAQNPGANYVWELNDAPNGNTNQTQSVNTSVASPPSWEYKVTVTDPITSCFVTDSVVYTINPSPSIDNLITGDITGDCSMQNGSISFTINSAANSLFSYSITGPISSSDINQSAGSNINQSNLDAGTYGITVSDQVTGCTDITTATINDAAFTASWIPIGTCDPIAIQLTPSAGATYPISYRVVSSSTGLDVDQGSVNAGPTITTRGLPSGNYAVELTATGGCRFSVQVILDQLDPVEVTFTPDICNTNTMTAVTSPAVTLFDWSESQAGSLADPSQTGSTVTLTSEPGTYQIKVITDAPSGSCPGIDSTTVTIDDYEPVFTQSDACQDQVTLTAAPAGSYTYRWFRNNAYIPGGRIITATLADDNSSYYVDVVSALNGCVKSSPEALVQVDGELTVSLATTTPCEGSPFTLTATVPPSRSASFQWEHDGSLLSGEIGPTLREDRAGTYTVTASAASCTATADIEIILAPTTPGLLRDEAFICPDPANPNPDTRQVVLDPGDFTSYDWFKDGVNLGVPDPTLTADEPGRFSVNLINAFGCASTDRTDVIVQCDPVIVGPNAFRPTSAVAGTGGDMINQSFRLFTFFIDDEDFQIFIFNRWGEMIFQSPQREFRWNGGYNNNPGQQLPPGTYSYVVRYKSSYRPEEGIQEKRGGVVLLR